MAERPVHTYNTIEEIDAEIRKMEDEIRETELLHQNLEFVHCLARNILENFRSRPTSAGGGQPQATRNNTSPCPCVPGACRHICVSSGRSSPNSTPNSRNNTNNQTNVSGCCGQGSSSGQTSGSTVARVNLVTGESGSSGPSCCSGGTSPVSNNNNSTSSGSTVARINFMQCNESSTQNSSGFPQNSGSMANGAYRIPPPPSNQQSQQQFNRSPTSNVRQQQSQSLPQQSQANAMRAANMHASQMNRTC